MSTEKYKPIPVAAAQWLGHRYDKHIVIIMTWDMVYGLTHVTTWGECPLQKVYAAQMGDELRRKYCEAHNNEMFEDFRATPAASAAKVIDDLKAKVASLEKALVDLKQ